MANTTPTFSRLTAKMFSQLFVFVATVVLCASAQTSTNVTIADVEQAFTTAQIVPDGTFGIS